MNKIYKFFFFLIFSISFGSNISAKNAEGYVITNSHDTIKGLIQVSELSFSQRYFSLGSFNFDILYYKLYFKPKNQHKFITYYPNEILEFGFYINSNFYRFISSEVKTMIGNMPKYYFFYQQTYGYIKIFKNKIYPLNSETNSTEGNPIISLYLQDFNNQLQNLNTVKSNESVVDFLVRTTHADKAILTKAAEGLSYKDIIEIANKYNEVVSH